MNKKESLIAKKVLREIANKRGLMWDKISHFKQQLNNAVDHSLVDPNTLIVNNKIRDINGNEYYMWARVEIHCQISGPAPNTGQAALAVASQYYSRKTLTDFSEWFKIENLCGIQDLTRLNWIKGYGSNLFSGNLVEKELIPPPEYEYINTDGLRKEVHIKSFNHRV